MITTDPQQLEAIANALGEAIREAQAGRRVRLPVIAAGDAAGLMMVMNRHLDDAIAERDAEAEAKGLHVACTAGCSACCATPVIVSEGEAVTVAAWLAEHAEERARFLGEYPGWKRGTGDVGAALLGARTDEARHAAQMAFRQRHVMCAFNRDGLCSIYEARPARCRRAHALGDPSHCGPESDGQVQYYEHARTEATFEEQEPMRGAVHHALRPNAGLDLLCDAVHRLLTARLPRNAACPCGSGKKLKHCCG